MKSLRVALPLIVVFGITGCAGTAAFGRTDHYESAWPSISYSGKSIVSVSVYDRRSYVASGEKKPTFVGLMRGGFGNPFDVTTASGLPVVQDIESAIVHGLLNSGMTSEHATTYEASNGKSRGPNSILLVIGVSEWKSDTFTTTDFSYDISADVYDAAGQILGQARIERSSTVDSSTEAARRALTELLSRESIRSALSR